MFSAVIVIGAVLILAVFIGLPYYQAHRRRIELARREQEDKERARQRGGNIPSDEQPKK